MASIREESIVKAVGDPWSPADANKAPRFAGDVRRVFSYEHHLGALSGVHASPIAQAVAVVRWSGTAYSVIAQRGLDPVFGIGGISRISPGLIEVQLAFDMRTRDHWIAGARGFNDLEPIYGADVGAGLKTRRYTRVKIGSMATKEKIEWAARDASFVLEIFGDR